jgi:hypothetical protein
MTTTRGLRSKRFRNLSTLAGCALLAACGSDFDANALDAEAGLSTADQELAACVGDDALYDYNAFAASLAVAVANELGRWDANADFEVRNGKLELSTTGDLRCAASTKGCSNITAMLRLQDDAASVVPNHSPSIYRSKLTQWHGKQKAKLTGLVNQMLTVDKGIYRLQSALSNKYMAVDGGSYNDNAQIEQRGSVWESGADQWRLILENTKHKFKNVRSGKCLALASDSPNDFVNLVQQTCSSTSTTQQFELAQAGPHHVIRTKHLDAVDVNGASTADDARIIQYTWTGDKLNQKWSLVPAGTGQHINPTLVATAQYYLTLRHSGLTLGVDGGLLTDGAVIEQRGFLASDDRHHWYITPVNGQYQFVNRRSGKCISLAADTDTAGLVQKTCAAVSTQLFFFAPTGDGYQVIYTSRGRALEAAGAATGWDVPVVQGPGEWLSHRQFKLTPVLAGEPHRLTFSHTTNDAECGELNFWYDIAQPNGQPLKAPQDSFVQLIFAGGKETLSGSDINPFIAQQVSGNLVAIDPTYGLNAGATTSTGACAAACVKFSTTNIAGSCCSCNGVNKTFVRSSFNTSTYLCQ